MVSWTAAFLHRFKALVCEQRFTITRNATGAQSDLSFLLLPTEHMLQLLESSVRKWWCEPIVHVSIELLFVSVLVDSGASSC